MAFKRSYGVAVFVLAVLVLAFQNCSKGGFQLPISGNESFGSESTPTMPTTDLTEPAPPSTPAAATFPDGSALQYKAAKISVPAGTPITAQNPSLPIGVYAFSYVVTPALPTGLVLNTQTGVISGTPTVVSSASTTYQIIAKTNKGNVYTDVTIAVTPSAPQVSYPPEIYVVPGTVIQNVTPTVTSGGGLSFTISPALPSGLTFSAGSGGIGGTPTTTFSTTFTVTVSNSVGSQQVSFKMVSQAAGTGIVFMYPKSTYPINTPISTNYFVIAGTAFSGTISPALPTGLVFFPSAGILYGTPAMLTNETVYNVTVTDSVGSQHTGTLTMTVVDALPKFSSDPGTLNFPIGTAVNWKPSISGGATSYSLSPSDLPAGLSFNTTTGVITGTPTALADAREYTLTATGALGSASAKLTLAVVLAPPHVKYPYGSLFLTTGSTMDPQTPVLQPGSNGVDSYFPSAPLPEGLTLDARTGVISGRPTKSFAAQTIQIVASGPTGYEVESVKFKVADSVPKVQTLGGSFINTDGGSFTSFSRYVSLSSPLKMDGAATAVAGGNYNTLALSETGSMYVNGTLTSEFTKSVAQIGTVSYGAEAFVVIMKSGVARFFSSNTDRTGITEVTSQMKDVPANVKAINNVLNGYCFIYGGGSLTCRDLGLNSTPLPSVDFPEITDGQRFISISAVSLCVQSATGAVHCFLPSLSNLKAPTAEVKDYAQMKKYITGMGYSFSCILTLQGGVKCANMIPILPVGGNIPVRPGSTPVPTPTPPPVVSQSFTAFMDTDTAMTTAIVPSMDFSALPGTYTDIPGMTSGIVDIVNDDSIGGICGLTMSGGLVCTSLAVASGSLRGPQPLPGYESGVVGIAAPQGCLRILTANGKFVNRCPVGISTYVNY